MAKAKLKFKANAKQLQVAAFFTNVNLDGPAIVVGDAVLADVNFKTLQQVVDLCALLPNVNGSELDGISASEKPKAAAKK